MTDIRKHVVNTIEATQNPMAPIILQSAHQSCDSLARLMVLLGTEQATTAYMERLLKDFPDNDDAFTHDPNYIVALCGMLSISIERWIRSLNKQ